MTKGQQILECITRRMGGELQGICEKSGWTAAHHAVVDKSPQAIALLIAMGIPIDVPLYADKKEETPLAFVVDDVCEYGYDNDRKEIHDIVCQLVNAGANIFANTCDGIRCIDGILTHFDEAFALNYLHKYVCEPMQDCTNKDAPANLLRTLLTLLTAGIRRDMLEQCLVECIDFDLREVVWETMSVRLVYHAILKKNYSVLARLIDCGAKVHVGDVLVEALYEAAQKNDFECVRLLLEHGASAKKNDNIWREEETALHIVGADMDDHNCYAFTECVRLLRQHVSIFDSKWMHQMSPLYYRPSACDLCIQYFGHHWEACEQALAPFLPRELVCRIQTFFDVTSLRKTHKKTYDDIYSR